MTEHDNNDHRSSGNALFAVFGAVVLVGLLGMGVNSFIRGPLNSAIKQTRINTVKSQMQIASQITVMRALNAYDPTAHAKVFLGEPTQGNFGGLVGADAKCQAEANTASLPGTYKAWLSDTTGSPATRFAKLDVPYKLINGTTIATNWADLTDGTLLAPISRDEYGATTSSTSNAWTNTNTDGTTYSTTNTCNNWTSVSSSLTARNGSKTASNTTWTTSSDTACNNGLRYYCMQQQVTSNKDVPYARVFITSTTSTGNLGGLSGADTICQARATSASLPGTYKAFLSSSTVSVETRMAQLNSRYALVDGTDIATNWADLTDGTLLAPINKTETGATITAGSRAWTGSTASASLSPFCSDWADGTTASQGRNGISSATDSQWASIDTQNCANLRSLYCIQQTATADPATSSVGGDCDNDGVVEPLEFRPAGTTPAPVGGGLLPATVGIPQTDPWGSQYGYCVWDYGSVKSSASCQQTTQGTNMRLAGGTNSTSTPIVALISAGPDKKFTTTCRTFAAADTNANGSLENNEPRLVSKASPNDDDIILAYSYLDVMNMTGGLWTLKSSNTNVAVTSKNIEAQQARIAGAGLFQTLAASVGDFVDIVSGLRLSDSTKASLCNTANRYALRRNASSNGIEACDGTNWVAAVSAGGAAAATETPPVTQNIVFATSSTYTGNLGGLMGADLICQKHANNANLPGKYMAWISDSYQSPSTRFYQSTVPYKLVDGVTIANNWTGLTSGSLLSSINKTETNTAASGNVWSNTSSAGVKLGIVNTCGDWTDSTTLSSTVYGTAGVSSSSWTNNGNENCSVAKRLYCVQQTEAATGGGGGSSSGAFDALSDAITDYAVVQLFGGPGSGTLGSSTYENVAWGYQNFTNSSSATSNTAFGSEAMKTANGGVNTAFGYRALYNLSTGVENSIMGSQAGMGIATGGYNTGLGYGILSAEGDDNIALGAESVKGGNNNTALGYRSLQNNTTGNVNTSLGAMALQSNTTGSANTAVGLKALQANTTGNDNIAIGANSMLLNTTGIENTALGYYSLASNINGTRNIALGSEASRYTTGDDNVSAGYMALRGSSGNSTGSGNTALGAYSMSANTTGADNVAIGYESLKANTKGNYNVAVGYDALMTNNEGSNNVAFGTEAMKMAAAAPGFVAEDCTGLGRNGSAAISDSATGHCYFAGPGYDTPANLISYCTSRGGYPAVITSASEQTLVTNYQRTMATALGDDMYLAPMLGASNRNTTTGAYYWEYGPEAGQQFWQGGSSGSAVNGAYVNWAQVAGVTATAENIMNGHPDSGVNGWATTTLSGAAVICEKGGAAGATLIGANDNTAFGWNALAAQTNGSGSTAVGYAAGAGVTTTGKHTFIGSGAQASGAPSADGATAIGYNALYKSAGSGNTAVGSGASSQLVTGDANTSVGYAAGMSGNNPINASNMTAIGSMAATTASGSNLTAVGYKALQLATGTDNTAVGDQAGQALTTGSYNTLSGAQAGYNLTTASHNTLVGYQAGYTNTTKSYITAVGYKALYANTGELNTAMGYQALMANTVGGSNTAIGYSSMEANTIGSYNTAFGSESLKTQTGTAADCSGGLGSAYYNDPLSGHCYYKTGGTNSWSGNKAYCESNGDYLVNITSAEENAMVIANLSFATGDSYYYMGGSDADVEGVWRYTGGPEEGLQFWQGSETGAAVNDAYTSWRVGDPDGGTSENYLGMFWMGSWVWGSIDPAQYRRAICERDPPGATYNTAIGKGAMMFNTTGSNNTAAGFEALKNNTTGSNNTAIGYIVMGNNTTGSRNTAVGSGAGPSTANLSNTTAIGFNTSVTVSNAIRLGDDNITAITGQVAFTATSDARVKKDITPSDLGLDFIMGLKPVSYRLKQGNGRMDYGFLAQDIEESLDGRLTNMIIRRNDEMKTYELRASDLLAPLVKALQEQDEIIQRLQAKIDAIKEARRVKACTKHDAEGKDDPTP